MYSMQAWTTDPETQPPVFTFDTFAEADERARRYVCGRGVERVEVFSPVCRGWGTPAGLRVTTYTCTRAKSGAAVVSTSARLVEPFEGVRA